MSKIKEAQQILLAFGMPKAQQNDMSALTLLALCDIKPNDGWKNAQRKSKRVTKEIMSFVREKYKFDYAPNTRETFRRQVLHQFIQAGITNYNPDKPELPVNSPNAHYAISLSALKIIRMYGGDKFVREAKKFMEKHNKLFAETERPRYKKLIPITLNGKKYKLSPGKHNLLEVAVISEFAPRFAENSTVVYLGDTENKSLYYDKTLLKKLNISFDEHSKLPDIILYQEDKNWLFLIEAVTSHGPVSPKRIIEMEKNFMACPAGKIYVSAFPDFTEFKRHILNIAWETEVWIAETPHHLIHYNGDKFFGPRKL
ncbi:MAG: BsuBI/PstI family type II restriction endonuclease [Ignavibacteriae bacterium]|nr:BsuBI/PstI family type II restriction endonuclease [Ignavibacteriota bacterium]